MFNITPRKAVKFVTRVAVYAGSIYGTEAALNAVIGDQDESPAGLHTGSMMIGTVVGYQVSSITDAVIDVVADRRAERKNENTDSPLVAVAS